MKAFLKNYRQSPRKVRAIVNLVRGKRAEDALAQLGFLTKRGAAPLQKLLRSAISNAKATGAEVENLFIKEIRVDKGVVMKRMMPAAMGSAHRINKRSSHVLVVLGEKVQKALKKAKKAVSTKGAVAKK